jgi:hypothetical protein
MWSPPAVDRDSLLATVAPAVDMKSEPKPFRRNEQSTRYRIYRYVLNSCRVILCSVPKIDTLDPFLLESSIDMPMIR